MYTSEQIMKMTGREIEERYALGLITQPQYEEFVDAWNEDDTKLCWWDGGDKSRTPKPLSSKQLATLTIKEVYPTYEEAVFGFDADVVRHARQNGYWDIEAALTGEDDG